MFHIKTLPFGSYTLKVIENKITGESVSFIPDFGATLNQLVLKSHNELHEFMVGIKNYTELMTKGKRMFIGSKLSPFPNRINNGKYTWDEDIFSLPINLPSEGHAIHGLVYNKAFDVINETVDMSEGTVTLSYNHTDLSTGYPFLFQLIVDIRLTVTGLKVRTTVKNKDCKPLPISDGWHPYFKIGNSIYSLYLSVPADTYIECNENKIPTGKLEPDDKYLYSRQIGIDQLDHCFKLNEEGRIANVKLMDLNKKISLNVWMETGEEKYKYVQLYTPPGRESIAIEPMTCMPDALNHKKDLILLKPSDEISFAWGAYALSSVLLNGSKQKVYETSL